LYSAYKVRRYRYRGANQQNSSAWQTWPINTRLNRLQFRANNKRGLQTNLCLAINKFRSRKRLFRIHLHRRKNETKYREITEHKEKEVQQYNEIVPCLSRMLINIYIPSQNIDVGLHITQQVSSFVLARPGLTLA